MKYDHVLVIASEVENGAAREAATYTGRPKAERTGSERIKSLIALNLKKLEMSQVTPISALALFPVTMDSFGNRMRRFDRRMPVKAGKVRRHPIHDAEGRISRGCSPQA